MIYDFRAALLHSYKNREIRVPKIRNHKALKSKI